MMNRVCRLSITVFLTLLCACAYADSTVTFKPPPGDVSVIFLGNIFGSVDGVLAGSGSQIVAQMFGVFNSAVLTLGGIVLAYTLLISTMNTAHEGQMLGQKWSSVWVPIRSTVGLGLLLPKASGYCTMQIFVMWIVIQGVGAADSIWNAALSYLNRGGVIVQKQMDPATSATADDGKVMDAAMGVLSAQVCMQAMQQKITNLQTTQINNANSSPPTGGCQQYKNNTGSDWYKFCNTPVPNFLNAVDIVSDANLNPGSASTITQHFPDFSDSGAPWSQLTGVCGSLTWNVYTPPSDDSLTTQEKGLIQNSRTLAVLAMYNQLLPVSTDIINNAYVFNSSIDCTTSGCKDTNYGQYYYGIPLAKDYSTNCDVRTTNGVIYTSSNACIAWGNVDESTTLFNGAELQNSVAAYNAYMMSALASTSLNSGSAKTDYQAAKSFINEAESKGWLMAGAYFFKLAILNSYVIEKAGGGNATDTNSGLAMKNGSTAGNGNWNISTILSSFSYNNNNGQCPISDSSASPFCELPQSAKDEIGTIIAGASYTTSGNIKTHTDVKANAAAGSEDPNVYAYLVNANSMVLPTQTTVLNAGLDDESKRMSFNPSQSIPRLGNMNFSGGKWGIAGSVSTLVWNGLVKPLWNMLLALIMPPIMQLFSIMIQPMIGMTANVFNEALDVMRIEGVNPIIAIANMGTRYIDGIGNAWIAVIVYATPALLFPPAFALIMIMMPIVFTWMGIMLVVGFSAAYYVPFLPLLIFTFAGIGWMIGVIESMVAAPIVALGVTHPEGHEAFGKGDQAMMLFLNLFLRPSMMILGYIFGIILSYVGVWIMNAGFNMTIKDVDGLTPITSSNIVPDILTTSELSTSSQASQRQLYGFWSKIFLFYFTVLTYTTLYISVVQEAFQLIYYLPDKVLRWLSGGVQEQLGESTVQSMLSQVKGKADEGGQAGSGGMAKTQSGLISAASPSGDDGGASQEGGGEGESGAKGGDEGGGGGASAEGS